MLRYDCTVKYTTDTTHDNIDNIIGFINACLAAAKAGAGVLLSSFLYSDIQSMGKLRLNLTWKRDF